MSDYDSTVAMYDNQINMNNQRINNCINEIKKLEDEIEELKRLKTRMTTLGDVVHRAADNSARSIVSLPSMLISSLSVLRGSFFSNIVDVIKGKEYNKATGGIKNAIDKIIRKIKELQNRIESLRSEIKECQVANSNISSKKNSYISEKRAREQRLREESRVSEQKKANTNNNAKKTNNIKTKSSKTKKAKKK